MIILAIASYLLVQQANQSSETPSTTTYSDSFQETPMLDEKQPIPPTLNTITANIQNFAFSPSTINIKAGDTVVWTNQDSVQHTVTSDSGSELNSGFLSKGQPYSHTFNTPGTYNYHCTPHPNMKAKVIVS